MILVGRLERGNKQHFNSGLSCIFDHWNHIPVIANILTTDAENHISEEIKKYKNCYERTCNVLHSNSIIKLNSWGMWQFLEIINTDWYVNWIWDLAPLARISDSWYCSIILFISKQMHVFCSTSTPYLML
jgi:hypothetical protein